MRNFKKFLALVLAMLMISACAIGASAAFTDQNEVDATDYANAIKTLTDLGVISGKKAADGTVSFDPDGTLTREEASVIAAKLIAGSKNVEWTGVTTTPFKDVVDKWSFGYISYAADRGVLEGTGNGLFEPKNTLSVAEAVAIVIKTLGLKSEVAALDKIATPSPWYINYIDVAEQYGLLNKIDVFSYSQSCSRAEMAQIAYNALTATKEGFTNKIATGFDWKTVTTQIQKVYDSKVFVDKTLAGTVNYFDELALNAALTEAGYKTTANELKGVNITVTYNKKTIYSVTVNSGVKVFDYTDALLSVVKDGANYTENLVFDGVTYVASKDGVSSDNNGAIGGTTTTKAGLYVTIKDADNGEAVEYVAKTALPKYYKATAYDDNNDGVYNRVVLEKYAFGTIKANSADAEEIAGVKYTFDTITNIDGTIDTWTNKIIVTTEEEGVTTTTKNYKNISYTGETAVFDEVTPHLYRYDLSDDGKTWIVNVLEVAETVTGKLTAYSPNQYVTVDSVKYPYAFSKASIDVWTLNQTVSVFTVGAAEGKMFAGVAVGASKSGMKIVVDSVAVENGKAVITGFDANDGFKNIKFTVTGVKSGSKLYSKTAYANSETLDGVSYVRPVVIADKNSSGNITTTYVKFLEGGVYTFDKTTDGIYYTGTAGDVSALGNQPKTGVKLVVDSKYVYVDGTPVFYNNNTVIMSANSSKTGEDLATGKNNAYANTYSKVSTFNASGVSFNAIVDGNNKASFIYITDKGTGAGTTITAPNNAIVQIQGTAFEFGYDYSMYHAVDIMTGKAVDVKSAKADLVSGAFYVAKDNVISDYTTGALWMNSKTVTVDKKSDVYTEIRAMPVKLYKAATSGATWQVLNAADKEVVYGVNITWFETDENGLIKTDNGAAKTLKVADLATGSYTSYIVNDKLIIVGAAK